MKLKTEQPQKCELFALKTLKIQTSQIPNLCISFDIYKFIKTQSIQI